MKKIIRISKSSFIKFQTIIGAFIGLLCGIVYSFGGLIIDALVTSGHLSQESMSTPGLSYGTLLAFGALLGMPLIFAGFGLALGVFEALFYKLYVKWFGGIMAE